MTWNTRLMLRESAFTAVAFTAACYSYYLIAFWGVADHFVEGPVRRYMTSGAAHVELLLSGILFGACIGLINRVTETPRLRRRPLAQLIAIRTGMYLAGVALVSGVVYLVVGNLVATPAFVAEVARGVGRRYAFSLAVWLVLVVGAINFALEIARVVGPGNLWRVLIGRYRRPREERRVFLFMDLKGSTTLAERLGHRRYSGLLQECYRDLTEVVMRYDASIYQYVGDEVVLTWPWGGRGQKERESVHAFFAFRSLLDAHRSGYETRFGAVPEFRGGIDLGPVTVIEVGDVKREIVYHGDVLNTAARLLELCKRRGDGLVVSRTVGEAVEDDRALQATWRGPVSLRGKRDPVDACGLRTVGPARPS